jgi:steroid delta-isomerase-like uncharacterized protein
MIGRVAILAIAALALTACKPDVEPAAPVKPAPTVVAAPPPPPSPASKQLVTDYIAAWNAHDAQQAGSFFRDDAVYVDATMGAPKRGREDITDSVIKIFMNAVPNSQWQMRGEPIVDGDNIAFEWTFSGTNTGSWAFGVAATNQKLNLQGVSFIRIKDGKIAYEGNYYDGLTMNKQMGW